MNEAETIYLRARELGEPERADFVTAACGDDAALRARVEELLRRGRPPTISSANARPAARRPLG